VAVNEQMVRQRRTPQRQVLLNGLSHSPGQVNGLTITNILAFLSYFRTSRDIQLA
jgi:hypothetical protein